MNRPNHSSQRGQSAVESAIVLPLFIFLILSILQFGLIAQARYMAKYAAYRAVRVGVMNHADQKMMLAAAEAALLPVVAMPSNGVSGQEVILPTTGAVEVGKKAALMRARQTVLAGFGLKMVDVIICGPIKSDVTGITQRQLTGVGSANQVDFDDPRATFDKPGGFAPDTQLRQFLATKLRVQVAYNYQMPIPFANWIISRIYLGMSLPSVLRMGPNDPLKVPSFGALAVANQAKMYIAPIFENYAMRMQSDYFLRKSPLPTKNLCISFARKNPDK
jgi:hypothetical protein